MSMTGIKATKEAHDIRLSVMEEDLHNMKPMILYITLWSDDFEVNNTRKSHSVWIQTVTICPPPDDVTSSKYTYLL